MRRDRRELIRLGGSSAPKPLGSFLQIARPVIRDSGVLPYLSVKSAIFNGGAGYEGPRPCCAVPPGWGGVGRR